MSLTIKHRDRFIQLDCSVTCRCPDHPIRKNANGYECMSCHKKWVYR